MTFSYKQNSTEILEWLSAMRRESQQVCVQIPWHEMRSWKMVDGEIRHRSNHFFSVVGVRSSSHQPKLDGCEQPIIQQPEIGILGFLVRRDSNHLSFLIQAKAEPGNIGDVQIAPTVQATVSNYTQAHGGAPTPYLDYFLNPKGTIISNSLQSEQGSRFLNKYNRNATIDVTGDTLKNHNKFWMWCPWETIQCLLVEDYKINTDARSVFACSDWDKLVVDSRPFERGKTINDLGRKLYNSYHGNYDNGTEAIIRDIKTCREENAFSLETIPIDNLKDWQINERLIYSESAPFNVKAFKISVKNREVPVWDQPLFHSIEPDAIILVCQMKNGVLQFLLRKRVEIGFFEFVQLGPSLQVDNQKVQSSDSFDQYLAKLVANRKQTKMHLTCLQSDEGGRFYKSISRYSVVEISENVDIPKDESVCWMNLRQIHDLIKIKGIMTNEVRSLISLLLFYL